MKKHIDIIQRISKFILICPLLLWSCSNKKDKDQLLEEFRDNKVFYNGLIARTTIFQKDSEEFKVRRVFTNNSSCKDPIIKNYMDKLRLSYVRLEKERICKKGIYYSEIYIELQDIHDVGFCYYNYTFCDDQIDSQSENIDIFKIDKNWSLCIEK